MGTTWFYGPDVGGECTYMSKETRKLRQMFIGGLLT
jgi:hypothetical protein